MYPKLIIIGNASEKVIGHFVITENNSQLSLMDYLRNEGFPIASSCWGEGACKKCVLNINEMEALSCQIKLSEITQKENIIKIDYL